jgi:hypothetical protein
MASGARRVTLGFQGGQVLALRVSDKQLEDLNKSLGEVVYVSADSDEPRVGFG